MKERHGTTQKDRCLQKKECGACAAERRADGDWKQGEGRRDDDPAKHEAGRAHPLPGGLCCRRMHPQQVAGFATKGDRSCANVASFA